MTSVLFSLPGAPASGALYAKYINFLSFVGLAPIPLALLFRVGRAPALNYSNEKPGPCALRLETGCYLREEAAFGV